MNTRIWVLGGALVVLGGCSPSPQAPTPPPSTTAVAPSTNPVVSGIEERARLAAQVQINPNDPQFQLNLAKWDRDRGDFSSAEREFRQATLRFPKSGEAAHELGTLLLGAGRVKEALEPLQAAARLQPNNVDSLVLAGLACFRMEEYEEARQYVERAKRIDSKAASPYLLAARMATNKGTAKEAQTAIQTYIALTDKPGPGYYLLARMHYRQRDSANAEKFVKMAIETDANNPDYWSLLGRVYVELLANTKQQEGIACFEKALTLKPKDAEAHEALGKAYIRMGQWESALEHLRAALETASDSGPLLYQLGQALIKSGKVEEGRQYLAQHTAYQNYKREFLRRKQRVNTSPNDRKAHFALIQLCLDNEQVTAATALLDTAERKFGNDATLTAFRARIRDKR